ncbi:PLxRFG domain-containing protein [Aeromonas allosaccharophila]|uniref:PLxRFG domain-containing protein n=1 Tax=Aeromonas allosaccharophila TaxID=656 RepID=UPI000693A45B|nr:PLxRFG domain-containing protein [Aeromonas allosaccharophila]
MAKFTREDFMRDAMERYSTQQQAPTDTNEQGIFSDTVDMFQRGLGQMWGGDLETVGQIADSQGIKDAGRGVSAWADGQLQEVSTPMREAMGKQFFQENTETGAIEAGDAWADPRAWAGNFATVLGQFTGLVGGTKGAGVLAKPVLRGAGKLLAKDLVEGQARELVAKATVKDAIQAGALDSVRAAYVAAPSEVAKRAVLDKAIGRLTSIGYGAHAGAMASGMRAQQAEQEARGFLNGLGNDELNANPIYQQAYWELADGDMQGASVGDIRRAAIDSVAEKAATDAWSDPRALTADFLSGVLTGAGGGVGGLLGKVGSTRAGAAARGFVGEGATEAWQGGETQRAVNQAVQEWADETRDPMAGVLSSALNEGTLGGAFGGVVGGVRGPEAQAASKPVVRVERRVVTGDEQMDDMIHGLDQRQAERGASISSEIDSMFAGANNPLGSGKFDPIRDVPAYERQGFVRGSHDFKGRPIIPLEGELMDPGTGVATNATEQDAGVVERPSQSAGMAPAIEDLSLSGELMSDGSLPSPQGGLLPGATIDGVASEVGTELPAPAAAQIEQEQPTATPTQYNSLRLTRRGLPFSSEKEAALASRQDETPVPLDGGGFGIAKIADITQPQAEVSNEQAPQALAVGSEGQGDQLVTGEPVAAGAEPAITGLADRAGPGGPADYAAAPPVPDGQQQDDQTLTTPAPDAGVAVSEVAQPEPVAPETAVAPTPWAEAIDNPDGTITLKGEVPLIKQWAKDSGVKAIPGKGGMVVAKSSAAKVREYAAPAASEPVQQIEAARAEVAPEPTEAQKEAGNYKKGHLTLQGLDIALENPKGSTRSGTDKDGKAWQSTMAHDYGYIKRTLGADGDHVDVFIGDQPDSETVYVVDQVDPKTGKFDEHKVMMGFADEQAARDGYLANYEKGWKGLGSIKAMPVSEFKRWVKEGDTTKPVTDAAPAKGPEQSKAQKAEPAKEPERAITFSKQAMAQGEKPAKHLTRKEAELVTKEWFKQYRGASGIDVQIHATQADLEQALGLAAKDGLIRRAAFDDDNGTLHVAADTIANPKRMREILRHEVLAHYGLANVLGDGEYTKLISRLIKSRNDPSMKAVWDWVDTHYADEELGVQAEEVVAHLAELEQSAWRRGWDQVVAWVTKALRTVGFVPGGITAAETRVLIEGLGKKMKRGGPDNGGPDGGQKFSQEADKQSDPFTPNMGEADAYRQQLKNAMSSLKSGEIVIEIGHTPAVLRRVGAPDLPLRITKDIVRKATNGVKHDVPMPVIEQLPELLHDPIAVFDSKTEQGAKTILIDARDASGRPIITAVHLNAKAGRIDVNRIASVYGKDNSHRVLMGWVEEGLLRYAKEKQNPLGTTQGLQLPKRGSPERVYDSNILSRGDLAKDADKVRDRVTAAGPQAPARGEHESARDDGSLPPDGLKFSQSNTAADDSKTLEQSIKQKAVYQAGAALSSVKNWLKQGRPLMLGTLTDLQIDQVYRDITGGAVSQYQRLRTQMEADRNDILLDAETRIDPLWDALGKQEKADLSNLMHDATMARLHPDKSLDENSYYQEAKQKLERAKKPETRAAYEAELRTIELNHSALAKQYNALPANAKALYGTMLDTYTKQWESLRGAIEQRLEDLLGVSEGRAMAAEMRQKMEHALQHGPYFPLTRYGDYVIKASKGDEYVREHFERRADAEQAVKQYQRDGYNAVMTVKEEGSGDSANANQLGMEMLNFLDNADGVSKTALKDEIWQAMLRMMPDASYAKHAIHRRRVKGASRDAHRAYLNSVYHYARHVSKIRYGHKMQGELDKLSEQIRAGVAGEPSSLKPDDLEIAQQVLNEMNKRHDLNMNPTGKAWAGAAGNIGFLYYIGPSLASAVVNMTQNFTVMLPQLGAKYGFAKSASAMTEALRDYWRHGKFKAGTTEAWRSLTRSTTLPADERAMLERLYRSGVLDLTQAHSIAAKADTDQQDAKPMSKGWRRAMRWAGATFHNAEVLNREVAALAAYRLLKQAEPTLDGQQYADRVAEMVYDGHGNYAASNRPRYMRNDITKVLTQFKIYSQMMTYVLYSNAIKAAKGDRVAAKTLAGVLATHWVMAGVMGLPTPIAAVAYALAAAFDDDDDRSGEASFRLALTEALGPRAGELLAKGPMDAITNLSIAGRTGLGDLWWRSPKEGTEGDDLAWHAVQQLLGPVAGIGINMARGAGQMTDGHIQRGMETVLPKSIRDAAKALRQATEGEQTIKGDVIMDDVSAWNVAMQAIGFGSAQMAKNYDAREYIKGKERRIADKRSELMADYYNARKSGDMDAVQEVLDHIKMFNATHNPGERITGKSLALSFKSKLRSNERTQGGVHLNRNREYLREEGKFAEQ